jgi:hypothetical protein
MKNIIWVAADADGLTYQYDARPELLVDAWFLPDYHGLPSNKFGVELQPLELAEVVIDVKRGTFEVIKVRRNGWYLTSEKGIIGGGNKVTARYWNGVRWFDRKPVQGVSNAALQISGLLDSQINVVSDPIDGNDFLESYT